MSDLAVKVDESMSDVQVQVRRGNEGGERMLYSGFTGQEKEYRELLRYNNAIRGIVQLQMEYPHVRIYSPLRCSFSFYHYRSDNRIHFGAITTSLGAKFEVRKWIVILRCIILFSCRTIVRIWLELSLFNHRKNSKMLMRVSSQLNLNSSKHSSIFYFTIQ